MKIKYSFVVLNWNTYPITTLCLEALAEIKRKDFEVILVENGSVDGSKEEIPKVLKRLNLNYQYIDLPKNLGFTGGNIEALKHAKGDILCPLNTDAVVSGDILDEVDKIFAMDEKIAVIGGKAFHWDEHNPVFSESNSFYTYQTVNTKTAEVTTESEDTGREISDVNNVSGSCCFIRKSAIDKYGYFDKRFFAYYEETDLFARFKRGGLRVVYSPNVKIWHKLGASSNSDFMMRQCLRNQFMFAFNNFDSLSLVKFLTWYSKRGIKACAAVILRRNLVDTRRSSATFLWNILRLPKSLLYRRKYFKKSLIVDARTYGEIISSEKNSGISLVLDLPTEDLKSNQALVSKLSSMFGETLIVSAQKDCGKLSQLDIAAPYRTVIINERFKDFRTRIGLISSPASKCVIINSLEQIKSISEFSMDLIVDLAKESKQLNCINKRRLQQHIDGGVEISSEEDLYTFKADLFSFTDNIDSESILKEIVVKIYKILKNTIRVAYLIPIRLIRKIKRDGLRASLVRISYYLKMIMKLRLLAVLRNIKENQEMEVKNSKIIKDGNNLEPLAEISTLPVFINCRDTVSALRKLVDKCKYFGLERIYLLDNNSSYPPLLKFFRESYSSRFLQPIMLGDNIGHTAPWDSLAIQLLSSGSSFILSDPDVVPIDSSPKDTVYIMDRALKRHPKYRKIGLSLKIDDLPSSYTMRDKVITWEKRFWKQEVEENVYEAGVDTTFALYNPSTEYFTEPSLRIAGLLGARHTPWYQDSAALSKEDLYYKSHAKSTVNTWNKEDLPDHFKEIFEMHT